MTNPFESPVEQATKPPPLSLRLSDVRWWHLIGLTSAFVLPFLFQWFYWPISQTWTVDTFGAGGTNLTGQPSVFDANFFNAILWLLVFLFCSCIWCVTFKSMLKQELPMILIVIPLNVIGAPCLHFFVKGCWFWVEI
ncbi:MAG: hypothetical protein COA78_13915 [Blastopirellula sp.]|nr:MAG: hypothetical protein COA78_13915 [Blastopirellula sp.]